MSNPDPDSGFLIEFRFNYFAGTLLHNQKSVLVFRVIFQHFFRADFPVNLSWYQFKRTEKLLKQKPWKTLFWLWNNFKTFSPFLQALLDQEMDLVQGEIIKITEIVDKDWYRGEANGKSGIFPSSFVRIIDSFPGDAPPDSADLSSYLKKPERWDRFLTNTIFRLR